MSCACKLGLGSYSQCDPVDVELREWKPEFLSQSPYTVATGEEAATYINSYLDDVQVVEDLSHLEPMDAIDELNAVAQEAKNTGKFWVAAGIAFLLFK